MPSRYVVLSHTSQGRFHVCAGRMMPAFAAVAKAETHCEPCLKINSTPVAGEIRNEKL
jgi:hypothetical protein